MSSDLTDAARAAFADLAARYNVSTGAVEALARAVANGGGTMAQFDIPELGGSGQWMAGGMTMVGDMFNNQAQSTVAGLCTELSNAMAGQLFFVAPRAASGRGWPAELGLPTSAGGQNALRYAYFADAKRLAVDLGDGSPIRVYDTLDHAIGGFSQQQSGVGGDPMSGLTFSSQYGQYAVASLPPAPLSAPQPISAPSPASPPPQSQRQSQGAAPIQPPAQEPPPAPVPEPVWSRDDADAPSPSPVAPDPDPKPAPGAEAGAPSSDAAAILDTIARLAELRDAGALTEAEFSAKKAELLARL